MAEAEMYKGSCLCGHVTFKARGASEGNIACYCTQCQKNSGSTHQIASATPIRQQPLTKTARTSPTTSRVATFSLANMTVSDPQNSIKIWNVPGESCSSGLPKEKVFCGNCGCTLWTIPAALKGKGQYVRTSLFDGGLTNEKLKPTMEIFKTA
ncbi:hypothetical protein GGTG_03623 [Gaeumannomyces tritici R3-111a-1]|uniref:CENP-V/GFA domain-containing protein n=1 Tax=Gaeumannomyces tritici (strain R3-111a-1) TaxID=644352 RepID=J3NQR7_GAET3|nr:hypothetical protein GGTG_03623 [Gaeumannomyces tritici R3-111a-1]EJT78523.1 hypothetical protein GGTG_03623 [Gaeumannomyces tritici R3-111a-1]